MPPKVSIIWLNYNSSGFLSLALRSLGSLFELDYPDYEVIVVDNCSTDGSFEAIKRFAARYSERAKLKVVRSERNLGFTGGNNLGFRARDRDSKYVVLVNNDFVMHPRSLELVEWMESEERVGAAQGVVLNPRGALESYGTILDELLAGHGLPPQTDPRSIKAPLSVTCVLGACSVYSVQAVREAWRGAERLFFDWAFGYFDDTVLSLQLWNAGWRCRAYPVITGKHFESRSFGTRSPLKAYLNARNYVILVRITNSRYKRLLPLMEARVVQALFSRLDRRFWGYAARAYRDALKAASLLLKHGFRLDLYKAPVIKLELSEALGMLTLRRRVVSRVNERIGRWYFERLREQAYSR